MPRYNAQLEAVPLVQVAPQLLDHYVHGFAATVDHRRKFEIQYKNGLMRNVYLEFHEGALGEVEI